MIIQTDDNIFQGCVAQNIADYGAGRVHDHGGHQIMGQQFCPGIAGSPQGPDDRGFLFDGISGGDRVNKSQDQDQNIQEKVGKDLVAYDIVNGKYNGVIVRSADKIQDLIAAGAHKMINGFFHTFFDIIGILRAAQHMEEGDQGAHFLRLLFGFFLRHAQDRSDDGVQHVIAPFPLLRVIRGGLLKSPGIAVNKTGIIQALEPLRRHQRDRRQKAENRH